MIRCRNGRRGVGVTCRLDFRLQEEFAPMSFNISAKTPTDVLPSIAVVLSQKNSSGAQGQLHCQMIDKLPLVVVQRSPLSGRRRRLYSRDALAARSFFLVKLAFWHGACLKDQTDKHESKNTAC